MEKLYNRTNWVDNNEPDIDAAHLNNIESGIDAIDNRVIDLNDGLSELDILGWTTPKDCPIQNEISGNQLIQKVGRIDLGSLGFIKTTVTAVNRFKSNAIADMKIFDDTKLANIYCDGYTVVAYNNLMTTDKVIAGSDNHCVYINAPSYTDATAFTNSMKGKYLYYELTTPITHSLYNTNALDNVSNTLNDLAYSEVAGGKNLIDSSKLLQGTINNVGVFVADNNRVCTEYIPVDSGSTYTMSVNESIRNYSFFDANRGFISVTPDTHTVRTVTVTVPSNAKYIRIATCRYNAPTTAIKPSEIQLQLEKGETATSFIPYIKSNAQLTHENESLNDYGMNNKFDGQWVQGYRDGNTTVKSDSSWLCSKNRIACVGGKPVKVLSDVSYQYLQIVFFNNDTFVSNVSVSSSSVNNTVAPSNANNCYIQIRNSSAITPSQVGRISVYVDNAIDGLIKYIEVDLPSESYASNGVYSRKLTFDIPSGYGILSITKVRADGGGSGYVVFVPDTDKNVTIFNPYSSALTVSAKFLVAFIKK